MKRNERHICTESSVYCWITLHALVGGAKLDNLFETIYSTNEKEAAWYHWGVDRQLMIVPAGRDLVIKWPPEEGCRVQHFGLHSRYPAISGQVFQQWHASTEFGSDITQLWDTTTRKYSWHCRCFQFLWSIPAVTQGVAGCFHLMTLVRMDV